MEDYDDFEDYEEYEDDGDYQGCKFCGASNVHGNCPYFDCSYEEYEPDKPTMFQRFSLWAWDNRTINRLQLRWHWDWKPWVLRQTVWRLHRCEMEDCQTRGTFDAHYCINHYIPF